MRLACWFSASRRNNLSMELIRREDGEISVKSATAGRARQHPGRARYPKRCFNGSASGRSNSDQMTTRSNRFVFKLMKSFLILIPLICATGLRAATPPQTEQNPPPLDPKNMDTSVKPGDDFFRYANGAWIKRTEIPPEYSRWGAFNELIE